ncbi:IMP dehydrogenase [Candidatus Woesearchaeota archaeon]|nr:IMP dehydrogenase [Candidatus Woesearchaeota archaeon]
MRELCIALTYDDVRLKTGRSRVVPDKVSTATRFSRNVMLKIPIVSAAMDTVTEYKLAIELAKLGGLGIIHRNLTPEEQAYHVARVKNHLNGLTGLIEKPICVREDDTLKDILYRKEKRQYPFDSFPVMDDKGRLVGILTGNDFGFWEEDSLGLIKVKQAMTTELRIAKQGTSLDHAYLLMKKMKKKHLPLVDDKGMLVGLYSFKDLKNIKSGKAAGYNLDKKGKLVVGAAIGVGEDAFERLKKLAAEHVDVVVIDTAHGDSEKVIETLKKIKKLYPKLDVVVGNVSEAESAERLMLAGADGVKVGQGPGAICTTRIIAGIGKPQVSAVYECSKIGDKYDVPICADGGLRFSGDITLAIGAGASSVMMGSLLAGTDEAPGDVVFKDGRSWKEFRGMGSLGAMEKSKAARERYGQTETGKSELIPEGVEALTPYKGALGLVVKQYVGGLKRGMGYVGAADIEELRAKADFIRLTNAGQSESHPHDVEILREAPNYSVGRR